MEEKQKEELGKKSNEEVSKLYVDDMETYKKGLKSLTTKPLYQLKLTRILSRDPKALRIINNYLKQGKRIDQLTQDEWDKIPVRTRKKIEDL